jgi:hypothetical protein
VCIAAPLGRFNALPLPLTLPPAWQPLLNERVKRCTLIVAMKGFHSLAGHPTRAERIWRRRELAPTH